MNNVPVEGESFVYEGFFNISVDNPNKVTIKIAPAVKQLSELDPGVASVWRRGTLYMSADRNHVDVHSDAVYSVKYTGATHREAAVQSTPRVVFYETAGRFAVRKGFLVVFNRRDVSYLPVLTRYILDDTSNYALSSHFYNHAVVLSVTRR